MSVIPSVGLVKVTLIEVSFFAFTSFTWNVAALELYVTVSTLSSPALMSPTIASPVSSDDALISVLPSSYVSFILRKGFNESIAADSYMISLGSKIAEMPVKVISLTKFSGVNENTLPSYFTVSSGLSSLPKLFISS